MSNNEPQKKRIEKLKSNNWEYEDYKKKGSGFNLTFQKWFVIFSNKNNHKTDLTSHPPRLIDKKQFSL